MKFKISLLLLTGLGLLFSCQTPLSSDAAPSKKGLIKITILYPNAEGKTFDMDYYQNKHMPMLAQIYGESMKFLEIDQGVSGRSPEEEIPFLAIGYLYFEKLSDYQEAFAPNADKILGDIPNYTNIKPIVLISKVVQ